MNKLKPRTKEYSISYVPVEIREFTTTDVTYRAVDMELLKKYFPFIYEDVVKDSKKLVKRKKGSKD